jgi:hypothetical protein
VRASEIPRFISTAELASSLPSHLTVAVAGSLLAFNSPARIFSDSYVWEEPVKVDATFLWPTR